MRVSSWCNRRELHARCGMKLLASECEPVNTAAQCSVSVLMCAAVVVQ